MVIAVNFDGTIVTHRYPEIGEEIPFAIDTLKMLRQEGKKSVVTLNLTDANIINSPYYYLQQNDVVYVEPNKIKAQNSKVGQTTTLWFSGHEYIDFADYTSFQHPEMI